jgi:hypothetical protein
MANVDKYSKPFEVPLSLDDLDPETRHKRGELSYADLLAIRMAEQELAEQIREAREWRARSQSSDVLL